MRRPASAEARYRAEVRSEARAAAYLAGFWYVVVVAGIWAAIHGASSPADAVALVSSAIAGVL